MITESLRNLLVDAGITPDYEDLTLVSQAVQTLTTNGASVAEMIAATITDKAVTPGRQHYHPLHPKKYIRFQGRGSDGTCTIDAQKGGTARVERVGTGYYRLLFSATGSGDNMDDANYVAIVTPQRVATPPGAVGSWNGSITATSSYAAVVVVTAQDATGLVFKCEGNGVGTAIDSDYFNVLILGELP